MRALALIGLLALAACGQSVSAEAQACEDRGGVYHEERQECFGAEASVAAVSPTARPTARPTAQPTARPTPRPTPVPTPQPTPTPAPRSFDEQLIAAANVAYNDLFRNSDDYLFSSVYFRGEVIQVLGEPGDWTLRVNVTPGNYGIWSDTVMVWYSGDDRFLDDDIVDLVGTSMGPYTYESVMGGDVTVPLIMADANGMRLVE